MKSQKYQKIILAIAVLTFVFTAGLSSTQAKAFDDKNDELSRDLERAELVLESIEYGNYETWRKLINPNSKIAREVAEDDFLEFVRARNLARQGKYREALKLYEDLKIKLNLDKEDIDRIVSLLGMGVADS